MELYEKWILSRATEGANLANEASYMMGPGRLSASVTLAGMLSLLASNLPSETSAICCFKKHISCSVKLLEKPRKIWEKISEGILNGQMDRLSPQDHWFLDYSCLLALHVQGRNWSFIRVISHHFLLMSSAEGTNLGAEPPAALTTKWFVQNNLIYEKPLVLRFLRFASFYTKVMEEEDRK